MVSHVFLANDTGQCANVYGGVSVFLVNIYRSAKVKPRTADLYKYSFHIRCEYRDCTFEMCLFQCHLFWVQRLVTHLFEINLLPKFVNSCSKSHFCGHYFGL